MKRKLPLSTTGVVETADGFGYVISKDLGYENWLELLELESRAMARGRQAMWRLGDLLLHGKTAYGKKYTAAMEITGLSYSQLSSLTSTAGHFDSCRRRQKLSFGHHQAVMRLSIDMQDKYLDLAEEHGWTRDELRQAITTHGFVHRPDRPCEPDPEVIRSAQKMARTEPEVLELDPGIIRAAQKMSRRAPEEVTAPIVRVAPAKASSSDESVTSPVTTPAAPVTPKGWSLFASGAVGDNFDYAEQVGLALRAKVGDERAVQIAWIIAGGRDAVH
jgi:hypothetical protein